MTRPRVPESKRQRTAQACESCKRRKQKCNGLQPCNTCSKRNLTCGYATNGLDTGPSSLVGSPTKRRHVEGSPATSYQTKELPEPAKPESPETKISPSVKKSSVTGTGPRPKSEGSVPLVPLLEQGAQIHNRNISVRDAETSSRHSTTTGPDEEADVLSETRMLQDPTGRLLYLGDSATLSYLQYIRMVVESLAGPSPFTTDPSRHRFMEVKITLPPSVRPSGILPDRQTANILIESYFINTSGFLEVFDKRAFLRDVDACYSNPLSASPAFLCLLYLTLAIGLVLAAPREGSSDHITIHNLLESGTDRAELFFRNAKALGDPTTGFEDADFWSVQALVLMSVYMLARTKRNASYAYYGMAVRSAFSLGLHRRETMVIFNDEQQVVRRNLWRTLYVLDLFLAAALGRPSGIPEDECSEEALASPEGLAGFGPTTQSAGLDASIRICRMISVVLKKVYGKGKVTTREAHHMADMGKTGAQQNHPSLFWRRALDELTSPADTITILHINMLYCHAVILLTRPFLVYLIDSIRREQIGVSGQYPPFGSRMEKFSEACLSAANYTISLVQIAYDRQVLSRRNPFIIHFLFAATLVILTSEFACLYRNSEYRSLIVQAISIMEYCGQTDPQAERLLYILKSFRDVVTTRDPALFSSRSRVPPAISTSLHGNCDPLSSFFILHDPVSSAGTRPGSVGLAAPGHYGTSLHGSLPSPSQLAINIGSPSASSNAVTGPGSRSTMDLDESPKLPPILSVPKSQPISFTAINSKLLGALSQRPVVETPGLDDTIEFASFWNWSSAGMNPLSQHTNLQSPPSNMPPSTPAHQHLAYSAYPVPLGLTAPDHKVVSDSVPLYPVQHY